jgi:hypothetical protein
MKYSGSYWWIIITFATVLLYLASVPPIWDYDAYGSVISHIELDDPRMEVLYSSYFIKLGFSKELSTFVFNWILPIFVVPLRWTYALGVSPIYGLARCLEGDWLVIRYFFLLFHIVLATTGFKLILDSLKEFFEVQVSHIFLGFIFLSPPFIYWLLTLSPYSFHLFGIGLLLKYGIEIDDNPRFFSKASMSRALVQMLNYQYIPVVFILGLYNILRQPSVFFRRKHYVSWFLPGLFALITVLFLYARSYLTGKHASANLSVLDEVSSLKYDIFYNSENIVDFVKFVFARYFDILTYYFDHSQYYLVQSLNYTESGYLHIIVSLAILVTIVFSILHIQNRVVIVSTLFLLTSAVLYFLNIYPFMPSRHSLILYIPLALLLSVCLGSVLKKVPFLTYLSPLFLVVSLFYLVISFNISTSPLKIKRFVSILKANNVDRVVLVPCNQEPLFYRDELRHFRPLYKCGNEILEKITPNSCRIAVYSRGEISREEALSNIYPFILEENLTFDNRFIKSVNLDSNSFFNDHEITHTLTIFELTLNQDIVNGSR